MLRDLVQKIIIVLSFEYVIFFGAEVFLPGVVTRSFNINILLIVILLLIGFLVATGNNKVNNADIRRNIRIPSKVFVLLGILLLGINSIALYKVSIGMTFLYTMIMVIVIKLSWSNIRKFK